MWVKAGMGGEGVGLLICLFVDLFFVGLAGQRYEKKKLNFMPKGKIGIIRLVYPLV